MSMNKTWAISSWISFLISTDMFRGRVAIVPRATIHIFRLLVERIKLDVVVAGLATAQVPSNYPAVASARHVGEIETVTDKMDGVHQSGKGNIFLNMGANIPIKPSRPLSLLRASRSFHSHADLQGDLQLESPLEVQERPSTFPRRPQRNALRRRDVGQRSRSFAR